LGISREELARVAVLAKLQLSDEEVETAAAELGRVLEYVGIISREGPPIIEAGRTTTLREVATAPPASEDTRLTREDALRNAPERKGAYFRLPEPEGAG